jgi:NitT/TauT family transport system substrate-binding protein
MRGYRNEAIDVAALTADEALQVLETQPTEHVIFLVADFSAGADAIIAHPQIGGVADLRGRRVGLERTAVGALMLARALNTAGLSVRDVIPVSVAWTDHARAFEERSVDAVVTFEPAKSRLLAAGGRSIFDTSQIPGEIFDVLITRRALLRERQDALVALAAGWFRALGDFSSRPLDAAKCVAPREQVSHEAFLASLSGLHLPGLSENRALLGGKTARLAESLQALQGIMIANGLLQSQVNAAGILDDRVVQAVEP